MTPPDQKHDFSNVYNAGLTVLIFGIWGDIFVGKFDRAPLRSNAENSPAGFVPKGVIWSMVTSMDSWRLSMYAWIKNFGKQITSFIVLNNIPISAPAASLFRHNKPIPAYLYSQLYSV